MSELCSQEAEIVQGEGSIPGTKELGVGVWSTREGVVGDTPELLLNLINCLHFILRPCREPRGKGGP